MRSLLVMLIVCVTATAAFAQSEIGGVTVITVAQLKEKASPKDKNVLSTIIASWRSSGKRFAMKGALGAKKEGDYYVFTDSTGSILAEIDDFNRKVFFDPGISVYLIGEADYKDKEVVVEVNKIKFLKSDLGEPTAQEKK